MKHIHFIGICGVAMSALALAFKRHGHQVTGSDVGFYPPISTHLKTAGVNFYPGWHPEKMGTPDLVIVGNVAGSSNPEWQQVQDKKIPYKSYPEVIRDFFIKPNSIVCAGTYGKSTSTALITWILKEAGYDPSYMFGGLVLGDMPAAELTKSDWSIVEGDEYKASRWDKGPKFAYYAPTHLLLTSVVWDHADVYPTEESYLQAFQELVDRLPKKSLVVVSEKALPRIRLSHAKQLRVVNYGQAPHNTYNYANVLAQTNGLSFDIVCRNEIHRVQTKLLGEYMADNITGCFALADQIGIKPEKILAAIASFPGFRRRLEKRFDGHVVVFDDIAHSPSKAEAVLNSLKKIYPDKKIFAVFEPNTGNRKTQARDWYADAFNAADEVVIPELTKVKQAASDAPLMEGADLAALISVTHTQTRYIPSDGELVEYLKTKTQPGDVVVFLGSHGFRGMIEQLITQLS